MSIPSSFQTLIERIQPLGSEIQQAESHVASIKSRLEKQFKLVKFELIGSYSRGSAIRRFSDVDCMAVFSREDVRWGNRYVDSRTLLNRVRVWLTGRYLQTGMRRDQQALVVKFAGGMYGVDIVPAFFEGMKENDYAQYPLYSIPDGTGNWLATSPVTHGKFIRECGDASNSKLKKTVQLIKFWRISRYPPIPLQSFHLELLLSAEGICQGVKSYAQCVCASFGLLTQRQCRPFRDPLGISGIISATNTDQQRAILNKAANLAYGRALRALDFEEAGKTDYAKGLWNTIYNGKFPMYG
jgi:predicted nucleotidyltransferase